MLFVILAITLVALVVAGFTVPQRTITNGVENYVGEDKARARAALETVRLYEDDTFDHLFVITAYRVERVEECAKPPPTDPPDVCLEGCVDPDSGSPGAGGYFSMEVRRFTIFGLPYGRFSLDCDDPRR